MCRRWSGGREEGGQEEYLVKREGVYFSLSLWNFNYTL